MRTVLSPLHESCLGIVGPYKGFPMIPNQCSHAVHRRPISMKNIHQVQRWKSPKQVRVAEQINPDRNQHKFELLLNWAVSTPGGNIFHGNHSLNLNDPAKLNQQHNLPVGIEYQTLAQCQWEISERNQKHCTCICSR